jgi:hypothetical protein
MPLQAADGYLDWSITPETPPTKLTKSSDTDFTVTDTSSKDIFWFQIESIYDSFLKMTDEHYYPDSHLANGHYPGVSEDVCKQNCAADDDCKCFVQTQSDCYLKAKEHCSYSSTFYTEHL